MIENVRIAILSPYDVFLSAMDNEVENALHYYDDELVEYLKGTANTFSCKVTAKHEDSQYLVVGNKIAFRYRKKDYYMNIMNAERDEYEVSIEAYSLSFELLNEQRGPYKATSAMSFEEYLNVFDPEHVITLGNNEVTEKRITNEWTGSETILSRLFSLATVFSAELEFLPELNDNYSLKRIVMNVYKEHSDTDQGVGRDRTDLVLRYNKQISGIKKTSDITELYTAITPTGRDGLTLASLDKTEYDSEGNVEYRKPAGSTHLYAVQARDRFPSNLMAAENERYIGVNWEYDTDNVNTLYGQSLAQLKKNCTPKVSYEVEGFFDTSIGDTVTIADEEFVPELYLQARVTEQHRSFTDPSQNKTTFDNFKELQSQIDESLLARVEELIAQGKTYTGMISSDNGIVFKNGIGNTTLTAHVRDASGTDLTENYEIHWYKDGEESYIGNPYTITATDVKTKAVYRFEAIDGTGNIKAFYEVTVSNVDDGSTPEIGENGNWVIDGEDTGKPSQGNPGPAGNPTGITVSDTEPKNPYTGMLWKHTGTVAGLIQNATYRWTGTSWDLFLFMAENLDVKNLSALSANLGDITGGSIKIPWEITGQPQYRVVGTTSLSASEGGNNPLMIEYKQYLQSSGEVTSSGFVRMDYDGFDIIVTLPNGIQRRSQLTYTGLYFSDGSDITGIEKSDIEKFFTGIYPSGTFTGNLNNLTTPGMYYCNFSNVQNGPYSSGYGWILNLKSGSTTIVQLIFTFSSQGTKEMVVRHYINSQWYPWSYVQTYSYSQWQNITLASGYVASEWRTPQYRISAEKVEFRGQVARSDGGNITGTMFAVPSEIRPGSNKLFQCADNTYYGCRVAVVTDGTVQARTAVNSTYVSLDGIFYYL